MLQHNHFSNYNNFLFQTEQRNIFMAGNTASQGPAPDVQNMFEQNLEGNTSKIDKNLDKIEVGGKKLDQNSNPEDLKDAAQALKNAAGKTLKSVYEKVGIPTNNPSAEARIANFVNGLDLQSREVINGELDTFDEAQAYFKQCLDVFAKFENAYDQGTNAVKDGFQLLDQTGGIENIKTDSPSWFSQKWQSQVQLNNGAPANLSTPRDATKDTANIMHLTIGTEVITCGRGFKDIQAIYKPGSISDVIGFSVLDGDGDFISIIEEGGKLKRQMIDQDLMMNQAKAKVGDIINASDNKMRFFDKQGKLDSSSVADFLSSNGAGGIMLAAIGLSLLQSFIGNNGFGDNFSEVKPQQPSAPETPTTTPEQSESLSDPEKGEKSQKAVSDAFNGLNFNSLENRKTHLPTLASKLKTAKEQLGDNLDQKAFDAEVLMLTAQNVLEFSGKSIDYTKVKNIDYSSDTFQINFKKEAKIQSLEIGSTRAIGKIDLKLFSVGPDETGLALDTSHEFIDTSDAIYDWSKIREIFTKNNLLVNTEDQPAINVSVAAEKTQEEAPEVTKAKIEESLFVLNENGKLGNVLIEQNGNTITYKQKGKLLGTLSINPKTNKGTLKVEDALKKIYPNVAAGEISISENLKTTVENSRKISEVLYRINEIDDQLSPKKNPNITEEQKTKLGVEKAHLITEQNKLTNAELKFVQPPSAANFNFGPNIRQNIDAALAESETNQNQAPTQAVETQSFTPQLLNTKDAIEQLKSIKGGKTLSLNLQHFKEKEASIFFDPNNITALEQNAFDARIALFPESFPEADSYAGVKKEVFLAKTSVLKDAIQKAKSITIHVDRILVDGKVFKIDSDKAFNKKTNQWEKTEQWTQQGTEQQLKPQAPVKPAEVKNAVAPTQEQAAQTTEKQSEKIVQPLTLKEASADITSLSSYKQLSRTMRDIWEGKGGLKSKGIDKLTVRVVSPTGEKLFAYDKGNVEQGVPQASSKKEIMAAMFLDKAEAERFEPSVEFALKDQTLYIKGKLAIIDVTQLVEVKNALQGKKINKVVIDNSFMPDITNIPGLAGTDYDTTPFAMPFAIKDLSKNGNGDGVLPALKDPNTARDTLFTDLKAALGISSSAAMESGATPKDAKIATTLKQTWDPNEAIKYTLENSNNYAANLLGFQAIAKKEATSILKQDITTGVKAYLKARGITQDIPDSQLFDLSGIASKTKDALMLTPAEMVQLTQYTHSKYKNVFPNYKNGLEIKDVQGKTGYVNDVASFRGTDKYGNVILIAMSDEEGRLGRDDKDHEHFQKARTKILESILKQDVLLASGTTQEKVEKQYTAQWEKAKTTLSGLEWNQENLGKIQKAIYAINTGGLGVEKEQITLSVDRKTLEVRGSGLGAKEFIQISRTGDAISMQLVNTATPDKIYEITGLHKAYREQVNKVVKQESFEDTLAKINDTNKAVNDRLVIALKEIEKKQGHAENLKPLQQAVIKILSQPSNISPVNLAGLADNGAQLNNPNFIPKETQGSILNGLLKSQKISTESAINITNFKVILKPNIAGIGFQTNEQLVTFTNSGIIFGTEDVTPYLDEKLFGKVKKVFPNAQKPNQPMS